MRHTSHIKIEQRDELLSVFWQSEDYRDFLRVVIARRLAEKCPTRSQLARLVKVSSPFITKVLQKKAYLGIEHGHALSEALGLSADESLALFDKLLLARTRSKSLKLLLAKRIQQQFQKSHSTVKQAGPPAGSPPTQLHIFKVYSVLMRRGPMSVHELAQELEISVERAQIWLDQARPFFAIDETGSSEQRRYSLNWQQSYRPRESAASMLELGLGLRRHASYSLETRYPISVVDRGDHFVTGSYVLALSDDEIKHLSVFFAQIMKKTNEIGVQSLPTTDKRLVAVCFDMFDYPV